MLNAPAGQPFRDSHDPQCRRTLDQGAVSQRLVGVLQVPIFRPSHPGWLGRKVRIELVRKARGRSSAHDGPGYAGVLLRSRSLAELACGPMDPSSSYGPLLSGACHEHPWSVSRASSRRPPVRRSCRRSIRCAGSRLATPAAYCPFPPQRDSRSAGRGKWKANGIQIQPKPNAAR